MSAVSGPSHYDYTEGASAIDISDAMSNSRRARRDSQYSMTYDVPGSVFDGPGHSVIPSSISRMGHRRSLSRRRSEDSVAARRRRSEDSYVSAGNDVDEEHGHEEDTVAERVRRGRRSPSPARRSGVFGGLSQLFGGDGHSKRRPSFSQRSSASSTKRWGRRSDIESEAAVSDEEEGDSRWGYSSGEEYEEDEGAEVVRTPSPMGSEYGSYPPSPSATHSPTLPLLSEDQFFGEDTRIDIDLEPLTPPPEGPPSRQTLHLHDEDMTVRFFGYEIMPWRQLGWRFACVLTAGVLALLGHWFPKLWLRWVARERAFGEIKNGFVLIETPYRDVALFSVRRIDYPYPASTVFSPPFLAEANKGKNNGNNSGNGDANGNCIAADDDILGTLIILDYRYARFALNLSTGFFQSVTDWRDTSWTGVSSVKNGLEGSVRHQRLMLFDQNLVDIAGKSTVQLLVDEVIHPFYVFQIASIVLWSLDDYYYYAFCIFLISAVSIVSTLVETKKTIARMREMSRFSCAVSVFVDGKWVERESTDLVPGDIVHLLEPPLGIVPADMFLLSGDAIVNESMLTGESVPVSKIPVKDDDMARWKETRDIDVGLAKSFLYAGTKVVRIRKAVGLGSDPDRPALGIVVRTGFNTTKGALVRSMLFPKPMGFKFYRDSIRFIMVLAGIAGLGFCASAVQFVRLRVPWHTIVIRALDLITVVVPPALPATLSIGTSFALSRLRQSGIFCIAPTRVNVAGKVNVCCFDKTGTLTEDGLDILGVRGIDRSGKRFGELLDDVHDIPLGRDKAAFLYALATCHQLKVVDGDVIGDPLDVKMFQFTKWAIEEGSIAGIGRIKERKTGEEGARSAALVQTIVRPPGSAQFRVEDALKGNARHAYFLEFGVIRTFEFVSQLRRMSVIVKRLKSTSMEVYVKGAPEVMLDICEKNSFPDDYDDLLSYYTKRGYRVIAIAGKSIDGLSWLKAQRMKREQAESNLRFLGLIIFENKLKPGTTPAIQALRAAHLACRMITGDNPLTAVSVARECGLITQTAQVFTPSFIRGNAATPHSQLRWTCMDDPSWELDAYSLKPNAPPLHHSMESDILDFQDYAIAVTGDVFRWMTDNAALETLQRMFARTQIFARMSPDEKNEVIERLQTLGYTVLMCGDGANDCAALKAADVGLSLSEAEASVAAPFTSRTPDIVCVLEVIREGRAALVTSFSCFKYMALYSLIQFTTITLLYSFASSLGDFQFLYIDLFIIIPVAVAMGRTLPYSKIHVKRPTASLVSNTVLTSIVGQIILTSSVQFWTFFWVREQPYQTPPRQNPKDGDNHLQASNFENSTLFLVSCFQYILVAAVFSIGPPYRKPMWTNGWLILSLAALGLFNLLVLLSPPRLVAGILELVSLPDSARWLLLGVVASNVLASLAFERWMVPAISSAISAFFKHRRRRVRDGKAYKAVVMEAR
ncbi:P-type ATPase [Vararia minispora EC-137]|uniref:P-type ATPase n=1 Tax=Vararia minispora EC-137 TaxID=1314806 RepID=A0ACB8Q9J3_9AGAM|nr:P-type ATPase [Vararia minispora EC-137]